MDWYTFMSSVFEHVTVPIIILFGGVILAILKPYAKKITSSVTMKNEMEYIEKMTQAKSNLMDQIDKLVESAVGANMQLAEKMKANGQKLTEDQIAELNRSAKDLVMTSLPIDVLDAEGDLYKLIGGDDKLDKMISSLMEKHVYIYKLKNAQSNRVENLVPTPEIPNDMGADYDGDCAVGLPEEEPELPMEEAPCEDTGYMDPPESVVTETSSDSDLDIRASRFGLG